jgi:hypothetical protein
MKCIANPMNLLRAVGAMALAAVLAAGCGGGVGSGGTGSFASGPITGFGSVIVNDVRFDDTAAAVEDGDGVRRSRDDLRLGMTVDIDGGAVTTAATGDTASATLIRFDSELRGPVTSVSASASTFSVVGQKVEIDATTVFAESLGALSALRTGVAVEVYAVYDPAGARYRAKRVDKAASGATAQLRGPVGQLDATAGTLRIGTGSAVYAYGSAGGVPSALAVGQFVRLRLASTVLSSARWSVLSFGTALPPVPDADGANVKGLISSFTAATSFSVNGRPVDASNASFPDGRAGLALGVRVEVKGSVRNGTLRATEVQIQTDAQDSGREFELHGAIESVNTAGQTFALRGQTVSTVRGDLRYQNGTAANLVVGRRVEVKGLLSADGLRVEATNISFE